MRIHLRKLSCCAAALTLSACGAGAAPRSHAHSARTASGAGTSTAIAATARPPQPDVRCPGPEHTATTLTFRAGDGARLDGALVGSGPAGVLLLPEYPGSYCDWWPFAVALARHGLRVMLFDYHCQGLSTCGHRRLGYVSDATAAAATLRAHGARSVALVGASLGGAVALTAAGSLHPSALVDLSGERDLTGIVRGLRLHPLSSARRDHAPSLFAVARHDHYVTVDAMRAIDRAAGSTDKALRILPPSAGHGWDMLTGPDGDFTRLAREIITFLTRHGRAATL
jgi:dienelactone hydrolase